MRFVFMLALLMFAAPLLISGQVTIENSPFLYRAPVIPDCDANDCFFDTVVPNQQHRDVPIRVRYPRGTTGPLPLILWSHGGGPNETGREINIDWGRTLTRAGYIVIHMSHFWSNEQRVAACLEFGVTDQTECFQTFPIGSLFRPRDANVVLGALDFLEQNHPQISGRIDRTKIAVAGWSYGSTTAMTLAGARLSMSPSFPDVSFANPLPKVFMAFSPMTNAEYGYKADTWREVTRPVLIATGAGDVAPGDNGVTRRLAFKSLPVGQKYEIFIDHPDTSHDTFNLVTDMNHPEFAQWLASYALAYFDSKLKGNSVAGNYLISGRMPIYASQKVAKLQRK